MSCVVLPRILRLVTRGKGVKRDSRDLLPPDDSFDDLEASATSIESMDKPLVAYRIARHHPYGLEVEVMDAEHLGDCRYPEKISARNVYEYYFTRFFVISHCGASE